MNLHAQIMNLPATPPKVNGYYELAYKEGHRDARHAAAELSLKADKLAEELREGSFQFFGATSVTRQNVLPLIQLEQEVRNDRR